MTNINYKDLETKGYVIIPKFLNSELIEELLDTYRKLKPQDNKHNILECAHNLNHVIAPILQQISETTNIKVDLVNRTLDYFNNQQTQFEWHQDHQAYYKWQDSYNGVNFWIPLIKPDAKKAGLEIVPQNKLNAHLPKFYPNRLLGKGAKIFTVMPSGKTECLDNETDKKILLPININELAITPELSPGDALLMRHDLLHKSQVPEQERIAISIRSYYSQTVLYKEKLLFGGKRKDNTIRDNYKHYYELYEYFSQHDSCKISDVWDRGPKPGYIYY